MNGEAAFPIAEARRLTCKNVHEAASLLGGDLEGPQLSDADAVRGCAQLLASDAMMGVLIDTFPSIGMRALVAVGGGAFVSRAFIETERANPRPGLMDRVLRSVLEGRSVALTRGEIAAANAGEGLNIAVILRHWRPGLSGALQREVRRHLMEKFLQDIRGFRMREVLAEARDEAELALGLAGGFRLRNQAPGAPALDSERPSGPFVIGITREEGFESEGSVLSLLFHYSPPRLGFTPSQQRMLTEAIQHRTDAEIARVLGVSLSAVKKSWAGIFEKGSAILDEDQGTAANPTVRATRGVQKRHILLTYLREHPEELRPWPHSFARHTPMRPSL